MQRLESAALTSGHKPLYSDPDFPDFVGLRPKICEDSPEAGGGGLNEFGGPIIQIRIFLDSNPDFLESNPDISRFSGAKTQNL